MTAFTIANGLRLIVHHAIWGMMTIAIVLSPDSAGAQVRKSPGSPILSVAADRADGLYHRGEPVNFLVKLVTNGRPAEGVELPWVLLKAGGRDGGIVLQEGRASLRGGRAIVTGTLDEPGFLQCRVEFGNGKETLSALGGAGIDPPQLKPSLPAPDDFDAFSFGCCGRSISWRPSRSGMDAPSWCGAPAWAERRRWRRQALTRGSPLSRPTCRACATSPARWPTGQGAGRIT